MIHIGKPYMEAEGQTVRLLTPLDIDGEKKEIFVSVEQRYKDFLSADRGDAILIGILRYAMLHRHDIVSDIPISEELFYKVTGILLPTLKKSDKRVYACHIECETAPQKASGAGVGTGNSCGVDSFYTILKHRNTPLKKQNLTHLAIYNAGSFNGIYRSYGIKAVRDSVWKRSEAAAKELGLPLIKVDSNIHEVLSISHLTSHTYLDMFMVYSLQNLWSKYYYSGGADYSSFDLSGNLHSDPAHFELLLLNCFSTKSIELILAGAECNRTDKVSFIADNEVAQKYLHVCTSSAENCGVCEKCRRTLLAIDAVGRLEKFQQTFPIEEYKHHREDQYRFLCEKHFLNDVPYRDSYEKSFSLLYPHHKNEFDRYLKEANPRFVYSKLRNMEKRLEAMREQFNILDYVSDKTKVRSHLLNTLENLDIRAVAFYGDSLIMRYLLDLIKK